MIHLPKLFAPTMSGMKRNTMLHIGEIGPYDKNVDLANYLERFQYFVEANGIDADKKKAVFLSVVGDTTFSLIRDLVQPDKIENKTFDEIINLLKSHLIPQASVIVCRYQFDKTVRGAQEPIGIYINKLRHLSENCKFGTNLNERLRDKLVSSLNDDKIIGRLLSEGDTLTFAKACELSLQLEQNRKDTEDLLSGKEIHKMNVNTYRPSNQNKNRQPEKNLRGAYHCYRCNGNNHRAENCYFKDRICNGCHRKGHKESACRTKSQPSQPGDRKSKNVINRPNFNRKSIKHVTDGSSANTSDDEYQIIKTVVSNENSSRPITVDLELNGMPTRMEVDTGASVSVITYKTWHRIKQNSLSLTEQESKLTDYNGNEIPTVGKVNIPVQYKGQNITLPAVVVKDGTCDLIGRDWLKHVQLNWHEIFYVNSTNKAQTVDWLRKFPAVFSDSLGKYTGSKVHINKLPNCNPIFMRERNLPVSIKEKVRETLNKMIEDDILTPVTSSEWATPIVPVVKKDQTIRICGDYRNSVNKCTSCDVYPLPTLDGMIQKLMPAKLFSKLDLSQAYLQLVLDDESSKMCTLNTPFGLYRMNRLPYGVSSSPAIFQKTVETLLKDIPNVVVYIDDILLSGKDQCELNNTTESVLQRLSDVGLVVKKEKCTWNQKSISFLGHVISDKGVSPMPAKLDAIEKMKHPTNTSELKTFLGIVNYYRKFLRDPATILDPLHQLLKKDVPWQWKEEQNNAFKAIKSLLSSWRVLTPFDPCKPLVITTDASPVGIGAVLSHRTEEGENPIGFVSRSLNQAERNYSQTEREALAIIFGVLKFQNYLYGHKFVIETDHRPLLGLFGKGYATSKIAAGRISRWCVFLNQFEYTMLYKEGTKILHADTLSRFPVSPPPAQSPLPGETINIINAFGCSPVSFGTIASETRKDKTLMEVMHYIRTSWPSEYPSELRPYAMRKLELSIQQGCLMWGARVVIPEVLRKSILSILHEGHIGIAKMKALSRSFVYWPKIDNDLEEQGKTCVLCQLHGNRLRSEHDHSWMPTTRPWERLHADFAENFMGTNFLIIVDAYSKWIDVYEQSSLTSEATVRNLQKCFANYGIPKTIHTDNGGAFTSSYFDDFMTSQAIKHTTSAAYSPKTNGLAERCVQILKNKMRKNKGSTHDRLIQFLFGYRTTIQETTGKTPAVLMFGRELRTKLHAVIPEHEIPWPSSGSRTAVFADDGRLYQVGDQILARNFANTGPTWLIGQITSRLGRFKYQVQLSNGALITRHLDALRKFEGAISSASDVDTKVLDLVPPGLNRLPVPPLVSAGLEPPVPTDTPVEDPGSVLVSSGEPLMQEPPVVAQPSIPSSITRRRNPRRRCGKPARFLD